MKHADTTWAYWSGWMTDTQWKMFTKSMHLTTGKHLYVQLNYPNMCVNLVVCLALNQMYTKSCRELHGYMTDVIIKVNILQTLNMLCKKLGHVHEIYNQYNGIF